MADNMDVLTPSQEQVKPQEFTSEDVLTLRRFYKDVLPVNMELLPNGLTSVQHHANIDLQATIAHKIAEKISGIDPLKVEALLICDAILASPHSDTIELIEPARKLAREIQALQNIDQNSPLDSRQLEFAVIELARNMATRNLETWNVEPMVLPHDGREIKNFVNKLDVDMASIPAEISEEEKKRGVEMIIWDVGGVLITNPGKEMVKALEEQAYTDDDALKNENTYDNARAQIRRVVGDHLDGKVNFVKVRPHPGTTPYVTNHPETMEHFWPGLQENLGLQAMDRTGLIAGFNPQIFPDVSDYLNELKSRKIRMRILSDAMPPHVNLNWQNGIYSHPGFERVLTSPDIRVSKSGLYISKAGSRIASEQLNLTAAFQVATVEAGIPPWSIIMVDDNEDNIVNAEKANMKTVQFLHADTPTDPTSVQQLRNAIDALLNPSANTAKSE